MNPIKTFCDAGAVAMDYFLAQLDTERQDLVKTVFDGGGALCVALEIRSDGRPYVAMVATLPDGTRQEIAHIRGVLPTMQ